MCEQGEINDCVGLVPDFGMMFGLCAGLLMMIGVIVYSRQMARGLSWPVPASWMMWAASATSLCLVATDLGLARPALIPLAAGAVGAVLVILRNGLARMAVSGEDRIVLAFNGGLLLWNLLLLAGPVGQLGFDQETAMIFVVLSTLGAVSAAWPTLTACCTDPAREHPLAWFILSAAHGAMALAVMAEGLGWHYLIYPLATQGIHLLIGLFALAGAENSCEASQRPAVH